MKTRHTLSVLFILALAWANLHCPSKSPLTPVVSTGSANFAKLVAVGNSLTAGFTDGALGETGQKYSYPSLIARQVNTPFNQPLLKDPGLGSDPQGNPVGKLRLTSLSPLTITPTTLTGPPQLLSTPPYNNLAVPGAKTKDALTKTGGGVADLILQGRGTQVRQAKAANPTFIIAWLGSNDVLGAAIGGRAIEGVTLTPVADFTADYRALIDSLSATGAKMIVANIPDVTVIPFVTTIPPVVVNPQTREPVKDPRGNLIPLIGTFSDGTVGQINLDPNSNWFALVTLQASPLLGQGIGIPTFVPGGTGQALPDAVLVDKAELVKIKTRTAELNAVIAQVAGAKGIPVVDINDILNRVKEHGIEAGGVHLTTEFITGGLFSLDGVHPNSVGYGVVANEFIRKINATYGASIPEVNLRALLTGTLQKPGGAPKVDLYHIPQAAVESVVRLYAPELVN